MNSRRIWELDALRGACILAVVAVHLVYDLAELYALIPREYPVWFDLLKNWGGTAFFLLSGVSVTLGSRSLRRGLTVFSCGLICTAVTWGMYRLDLADSSLVIWFGALHCLGVCMLLWPVFRRMPRWLTAILAAGLTVLGMHWQLTAARGSSVWLIPLGLPTGGFSSPDYFPLLPFLGFFLLGAAVGGLLYPKKRSLLPGKHEDWAIVRFLCACGRQSLPIYLLHQPVLMAVCMAMEK